MGIVLTFLPFLAFALLSGPLGAVTALVAGTTVAASLVIRTYVSREPLKILETGTFVLFLGVTIYALCGHRQLSIIAVRLVIDLGLFASIVISIVARRPFTLQYVASNSRPNPGDRRFVVAERSAVVWAVVSRHGFGRKCDARESRGIDDTRDIDHRGRHIRRRFVHAGHLACDPTSVRAQRLGCIR